MEEDSGTEGVPRRPETSIPYSQPTILDAHRPLGPVTGYEELNRTMVK